MARAGAHVRHLQPRRLRAAVARDGDIRRRGFLDRRCRRAPARGRRARDLGDVPAGAHGGTMGLVDPRPDAGAAAVHGPPLAPRLRGAQADETCLARAPAPRRLGERARERRPRRPARAAPRGLRADSQPRSDLETRSRAHRPRPPRRPRDAVRACRHGPLLPPPPRRPAVRGARHGVALGSARNQHDVLLRARGDRDRRS